MSEYAPERVVVEPAADGQTCEFHAGCCEPGDLACPGNCHEPAFRALVIGATRTGICREHLVLWMSEVPIRLREAR